MSDETRLRLVEAAEKLFADLGVEGASLRQITRAARTNVAAIHYHFGSKGALLRAVLDRTIEPLVARRGELLRTYLEQSGGEPLGVEHILDAFLRPDVEAIERLRDQSPEIARFIGRTYTSPTPEVQRFIAEQFAEDRVRFFAEIERTLPHLSTEEIDWRMGCVVGVIVGLFARTEPRTTRSSDPSTDVERTLGRLIAFCAPALAAPVITYT